MTNLTNDEIKRRVDKVTIEINEIRKILLQEYKAIGKRIVNTKLALIKRDDLTDVEKQGLKNHLYDIRAQQIEVIRIWQKLFQKDYADATDEIRSLENIMEDDDL